MIRKHELTEDVLKGKKIVLFGAGRDARKIIPINTRGCEIAYICDNGSNKWGTELAGIPVCPPSKLLEEDRSKVIVLITTHIYRYEIIPWLVANGFEYFLQEEILNSFIFNENSKLYKFKRRIFALITGSVRNHFDMSAMIYLLLQNFNNGAIEGIVWSTWEGEPDKLPGLRDKLTECGICIIETPIPQLLNSATAQLTQIYNGLKPIPEDAWVIRLRTDGTIGYFNNLIKVLCSEKDLSVKKVGAFPQVLSQRIVCDSFFQLGALFLINDFAYAAVKNDMLKMCENNGILFNDIYLSPEIAMYSGPFLKTFPILADYYRFVSQYIVLKSNAVLSWKKIAEFTMHIYQNINGDDSFSLPSALNKVYAIAIIICYSSLYFCDTKEEDAQEIIHFTDLFSARMDEENRQPSFDPINGYLEKIINAEIIPSEGYRKLNYELQRSITDPAYALNLRINNSDYKEVSEILSSQGINPIKADDTFSSMPTVKHEDVELKEFLCFLPYFNEKEREQLLEYYDDYLSIPNYQDRLLYAIERDKMILPRVLYAAVLMANLRGKELMLLLTAYPKTYMRFAIYIANNKNVTDGDRTILGLHLREIGKLANGENLVIDRIAKAKTLTYEHLIAHYHMLKFFERYMEKYPQCNTLCSVIIRRFREFIGVTEQQCPNCETYHETARNIALYKLRTDEKWRHAELFRKAIDEITEK